MGHPDPLCLDQMKPRQEQRYKEVLVSECSFFFFNFYL